MRVSQKDAIYLSALHLPLAKISLSGDSDGWQRIVLYPTVLTTPQCVMFPFFLLPTSISSHLLHPQPHLIKGLSVVPPAPIEVSTINYPFIPAVIPSAQSRSPCPPLCSKFNAEKESNSSFSPMKNSSTCSFIPSPFSALLWCIARPYRKAFTMKEIGGIGEDNTGASIHPGSCFCSTSHQ